MNVIAKNKLKSHMLQILREIEQKGEELVITDHNRPVLKIVPYKEKFNVYDLFKDDQGKVIYKEDITAPTKNEWGEV